MDFFLAQLLWLIRDGACKNGKGGAWAGYAAEHTNAGGTVVCAVDGAPESTKILHRARDGMLPLSCDMV